MSASFTTPEIFLIAMAIIFTVPFLIWRVGKTEYYAPLVVVQIVTGVLLGPGILGRIFPEYYAFVFKPTVVQSLNGIAWWAVMLFVWISGIELNLKKVWEHRCESGITAGLALGTPFIFGCGAATGLLMFEGWLGPKGTDWQFILGIGMACAVTALPILILFMEKLEILRSPIGQRILRYASLDDLAIWAMLAVILMDWRRIEYQAAFLFLFAAFAWLFRRFMARLPEPDRWYAGLIWLLLCAFGADRAGLHFMVGAFLSGTVLDSEWFEQREMDLLRHHVLLIVMPVFFLSTGLKTQWNIGGETVFIAAVGLLLASVSGKLAATHLAGKLLGWAPDDAAIIGWLLQTKALIMIIFADILLERGIISSECFTALLLMAVMSTMITVPMVSLKLERIKAMVFRTVEETPD